VNKSKASKNSFDKSLRKWPYIFLAPFAISYIGFFLFPTFYSLYMSFFRWNVGEKPKFTGVQNYVKLFTHDAYFWKSMSNTFIIMLFVIPLCIIVGLFLAELLFNESLKFRGFFQIANYLPYVTTPIAVAIIFSLLFDQKIGVVNLLLVKIGIFEQGINWLTAPSYMQRGMLILMILWQWAGYYMLIYLAGMSSISADVYEAAKVDGASRIKIFFKITLPLLSNVTFFLVITSVIFTLQIMDQPYLLLRGLGQGSQQSLEKPLMTVMVYFYENCLRQGRLGYGAALTYSLFMVILAFTFLTLFIIKKRGGNNEED